MMNLTGPVLRCFTGFRFYRLRLCLVLLPLTWGLLLAGLRVGGLLGVMAAVMFVRLIDVVVTTAFIVRKLGMSRKDFRYLTPLLRTAAAAVLAATVTMVMKKPLESWPPLVSFLTCSCVFGLVYLIAALVIGAVTDAERAALQRLLGRFLRPWASRAHLSSSQKL